MLRIEVPEIELFNEQTNEFITYPKTVIKMENSLVAISKWESRFHKSFFKKDNKTKEEILDYIYCMIYDPEYIPYDHFLNFITINKSIYDQIIKYINDSMTATCFRKTDESKSSEVITSELLYYQMIQYNIPYEFEKWHINRLITLIRVCAIKNSPPKKRSMRSIMAENDALNELRKKQLGTRG